MSSVVVVGTQWGDEGKGKVTDYLAEQADVVVRYQGGPNAGHTVVLDGREYKLHLVPSGILYPEKVCVIGNGVVLDPAVLTRELDYLRRRGIGADNLYISDRAHLIFPYHVRLDELEEERKGSARIGTTRRGVGPAYMDKAARVGIRVGDLMDPEEFRTRLESTLPAKNALLEKVYHVTGFDLEDLLRQYLRYAEVIRPYVTDTSVLVNDALSAGKNVLFEGAQGTLLDIDFGTYPYVTSSHPVAGAACIGAGVGPTRIDRVVGVVKAYTSRVGDGPFPTELNDRVGEWIRERGHEYGTTTGRPRRCGWLDMVIVRHALRVSGMDALAVTRLDVLSGLPNVRICVGYRHRGRVVTEFPSSLKVLGECEPEYRELPGWQEDLVGCQDMADLPPAAREYLQVIEDLAGVRVALVSIGRERSQTIAREPLFPASFLSCAAGEDPFREGAG